MIRINPKKFYLDVVESNRPIDEIFSYLSVAMNSGDYDELLEVFSNQLYENYHRDIALFGNQSIDYSKAFGPTESRVRLAKMLLSVCALGATFDKTVFNYSLDYILKKELSSIPLFLN